MRRGDDSNVLAFLGHFAEEAHAAEALQLHAEAYQGGTLDRLTRNWIPDHRSGDAAIGESWDLLTSRVRQQARDEPSTIAVRGLYADHVVGSGLGTSASVMTDVELGERNLDDAHNAEADAEFEYWCLHEADAEGRLSFGAMQRQVFGETADVGECLLLESMDPDPNRSLPLCYQVVEAEQIDNSIDRPGDSRQGLNRIVRGIEYDRRNRPVAYYLFGVHPYDNHGTYGGKSDRVPAARVLHYFVPNRPSSHRGISWHAGSMRPARDRDLLIGNVLTASNIQSLLTVIHQRDASSRAGLSLEDGLDSTDLDGNRLTKLGRGSIVTAGLTDKFTTLAPTQPGPNLSPFYAIVLQEQAMATRVSPLRLTRDYSKTNYSSARAAHNDDDKTFRPISVDFGLQVVMRVRRAHTAMAAAFGLYSRCTPEEFLRNRRRWQAAELLLPGRPQVDQEKETNAAKGRIASGLSTLKDEVAALTGGNWRKNILQREREILFARKHNVTIDFGGPSQPAGAKEETDAPEDVRPANEGSDDDA